MNTQQKSSLESEQSFEDLLGRAAPRRTLPAGELEQARAAIKAEWQSATRRRENRRRAGFAVAATVLVAVAMLVSLPRAPLTDAVSIAMIESSNGTIYRLGEQSELEAMNGPATILSGQVIETAAGASLGIQWVNGGSLRVDEQTRVVFLSGQDIEVEKGRIYYDADGAAGAPLHIATPHGSVFHIGTQYMVRVDQQRIEVSVREGRVAVEGRFHDAVAEAGERLTLVDSRPPRIDAIPGYGEQWRWIEATSPHIAFNGRHVVDLVDWFARETGLSIEYSNTAAKQAAMDEVLTGDFDRNPRVALRQGLRAASLTYRMERGAVVVSDLETANE